MTVQCLGQTRPHNSQQLRAATRNTVATHIVAAALLGCIVVAQAQGLGAGGASTAAPAATGAQGMPPAAPVTIVNTPNGNAQAVPAATRAGDAPGSAASSDGRPGFGTGTVRVISAPNEFQRFVAAATGQTLPVFGESYFTGTLQTFAPLDRVPVPAEYVLGPGDELYIRAWGNIDIDYRATIDRNGQISIPRVGTLSIAGLKAGDVEGHLQSQIGRVFKGFNLNVTLGQLRSIQIFVVGQARQPGTYTVGSLSTLVNAIFASGGPGANGSMRRVQLRRENKVITELDLYDFIVQGNKAKDLQLLPGDVIVYPATGPRVAVLGAVDTPAIYELEPGGGSLAEVIALAGGGGVQANRTTAQLERIDPTQPKAARHVAKIDLAEAAHTPLRDGDMLTIFAVAPKFSNAVTLRGNVAAPLRYPYTVGMRISDLIPERDALITPDYYVRKNQQVQFTETRKVGADAAEMSVRNIVDEPNWEYATVERLDTDRITTRLLPFDLRKAVIDHDPPNNLELLPGDVVTIFSSKDIRGPEARSTRLVRLEGEVDRPGVYQLQPGETLKKLIARAGGFTPQAYVYGLEFSREETRQRQRENLAAATNRLEALATTQNTRVSVNRQGDSGAAASAAVSAAAIRAQIAHLSRIQPNGRIALELDPAAATIDALPELPLEDADRISVPARPGFVTVVGAVANNSAFLWKPGRTVGDYVKLAGLDETAEVSNMFVLRADGSVSHASDSRGFFGIGGGFTSQPLYPGDAVVVPNQLDFETWGTALVRNLKDWSQIFSQFGLGAAAIKTLR